MSIKNIIIIIFMSLCFLIVGMYIALTFEHQLKRFALKVVVKAVHIIKGKKDPTRYNAVSPVAAHDGVAVFIASSLDRIFQDGKTLVKPSFSKTAAISLAKNEYVSFQVVVQTQGKELKDIQLEISDLVNTKTGDKIDPSNVTWRIVGYVETIEPYYQVKYVGQWPDPLLPADKVDISANMTQPFWVTIYTPSDTKAGDYAATITVKGSNFAAQLVPIDLHVYDFIIPKEGHLKTAFDLDAPDARIRYRQRNNESNEAWHSRLGNINDKFYIDMLKHRMDPILNIDPTSQSDLSNIDRYRVYGLNNFSIGIYGGSFNNNWPDNKESVEKLFSLYREYGEDLKLNDMLQYTYIYTWDEGFMGNPAVPRVASMVHRAYPGLKNMVCYHGIWDPAYGLDWIKDIDIWTFNIDDFNEKNMRKLQSMGKEIWMYVSGPAGSDAPNLAIDFDSIDYRIIPWLCWKYDIKGFLYWCVNWWPDPDVDPLKSAKNSKWAQNGNGLLFYPGVDGPWDSIRTENFRDGMQDYEYIQLLFEKLKLLRSRGLEQKYKQDFDHCIKLLTMDDSIVKSMVSFTKDGDHLMARRNAIALEIERMNILLEK